jgi:hypothetical protein
VAPAVRLSELRTISVTARWAMRVSSVCSPNREGSAAVAATTTSRVFRLQLANIRPRTDIWRLGIPGCAHRILEFPRTPPPFERSRVREEIESPVNPSAPAFGPPHAAVKERQGPGGSSLPSGGPSVFKTRGIARRLERKASYGTASRAAAPSSSFGGENSSYGLSFVPASCRISML